MPAAPVEAYESSRVSVLETSGASVPAEQLLTGRIACSQTLHRCMRKAQGKREQFKRDAAMPRMHKARSFGAE